MTSVSRKAVSKINYEPVKESVLASDVLIAFGILGYITVLLFNGVLMHVGLSLPILEAVRPFLPEFFLVFSIFGWLMNKQKVGKSLLISLVYFLIVMILSFGNFTVPSLLITLRNFLIPYFAMLLLSSCSSSRESFIRFNKSLLIIFSIFIVVGCGFSIIQQIRGWEWMSTYFQGYSSWGTSGNVRVVWSSYETLRTLGTTGDSSTFGLYSAFAIMFVLFSSFKNSFIKLLLSALAMVSIFNSGNKTGLLIGAFLILYYLVSIIFVNHEKLKNRLALLFVVLTSVILLFSLRETDSDSMLYSMKLRFEVWASIFNEDNLSNLFVPHTLYDYSSFGASGGNTTIWDNSYLFLAFSFGLIGVLIIFAQMFNLVKPMWENNLVKMFCFVMAFSMFSTNIFVGRNIAGFALIYLGYLFSNRGHLNRG